MKKILLIISICVLCNTCGVKSDPEYKSEITYNKTIKLI